ncbi:MAG: aminopeptidase P family protein [Chloroflexi bacterium]|nr:aminopeptidase P family protein [Chloroflexota bacterium]
MNLRRFEALLAESGMDGVIASSLENVSYLSGARMVMQRLIPDRLALLLWPADGYPAIVVCKGEDVACRDDCQIEDMRSYTEFVTSPVDLLADVIAEKGLAGGRLGLELHSLPAGYVNQLRKRIPDATLVDCGDLMDRARMIKTPEEVDALAAAGRATERAIRAAFERASIGEPEKKVADDITAGVTAAGADVLNFMFLGTGTRSFEWHARPGATRLEAGQVLHTDVAGNFVGYWSDLARTAFVGEPSPRQRDIYSRLYQSHVDTLDAIRPGLEVRELFAACQAAYRRVRLPFQLAHLGHGLGLGLHEYPMLKPTTDELLQPGMILCIEPAYLDPGVAGYHIEDLVLVTEQGREVLTDYEGAREAQVIT